jgi:hypothetical protein
LKKLKRVIENLPWLEEKEETHKQRMTTEIDRQIEGKRKRDV